jgi:hypothetical protein
MHYSIIEGGSMQQHKTTPAALDAIRVIRALRKNPSVQTPHAEKKIISKLTVSEYVDVVLALECEGK